MSIQSTHPMLFTNSPKAKDIKFNIAEDKEPSDNHVWEEKNGEFLLNVWQSGNRSSFPMWQIFVTLVGYLIKLYVDFFASVEANRRLIVFFYVSSPEEVKPNCYWTNLWPYTKKKKKKFI